MSNQVATIRMLTNNKTIVDIVISTSDHSMDFIISENMRYNFKGSVILGTGIDKVESIIVGEKFQNLEIVK